MSLVTVIIPYYNDEKFIRRSVESVLNQSLKDLQLILINHATTDSSRSIVHSYEDDRIFHIDVEKNAGAGTSLLLKLAIPHITGKYVKFLCTDDELKPDCLEKFVKFSEENNLDFCFSDADYIDENSSPLGNSWSKDYPVFNPDTTREEFISWYFKDFNFLPWVGLFIKTTAFDSIKLNYTLIFSVDKFICLDLLITGLKFKILSESLVNYRIHNGQVVAKNYGRKSVEKQCINVIMNSYEMLLLPERFYGIKDISLIKDMCADVTGVDRLSEDDLDLIPAVIDIHFMTHKFTSLNHAAYFHLQSMFQDDCLRQKMEKVLGFSIKEFRDIYRKTGLSKAIILNNGFMYYFKIAVLKFISKVLRINLVDTLKYLNL